MRGMSVFLSGLLFGAGVTISGMVDPMKVLNFMDITGQWDPTLIFVMGAGLAITVIGYRLTFRRAKPLFADLFQIPERERIDAKLLAGSALFGLGWGLSGFCPGPAVASLVFANTESFYFVIAMAIGMLVTKIATSETDPVPRVTSNGN